MSLTTIFLGLKEKGIHENILLIARDAIAKAVNGRSPVAKSMLKEKFLSPAMFKAYRTLKAKYLDEVYVSPHYCLLVYRYPSRFSSINHYYLIGVDGDSKRLFINKVNASSPSHNGVTTIPARGGDLYLFTTTDSDIWTYVLGYDIDYDLANMDFYEILERYSNGFSMRIQGDIVMGVWPTPNVYLWDLRRRIEDQLASLIGELIARRISELLQSYGLSAAERGRMIAVEGLRRDETYYRRNTILKRIVRLIWRDLDISDIFEWIGLPNVDPIIQDIEREYSYYSEYTGRIVYMSDKLTHVQIDVSWSLNRIFGVESYDVINIQVNVNETSLENKANDLMSELDLEFRDTTIRIGRHRVYCHARPINLNIRAKVVDQEVSLVIRDLPIIVRGEIRIEHPEHRTKILNFPTPVRVQFWTIRVVPSFIARLNKYILDEIMKRV